MTYTAIFREHAAEVRELTADLERARAIAVALENENALLTDFIRTLRLSVPQGDQYARVSVDLLDKVIERLDGMGAA